MEHRDVIYQKLGKETITILLREIENGNVEEEQIQEMSVLMNTNGIFKHYKRQKIPLVCVTKRVLDGWYKKSLHDNDDGFSKLLDILQNVNLSYLASEMEKVRKNPHTATDRVTDESTKLLPSEANLSDTQNNKKFGSWLSIMSVILGICFVFFLSAIVIMAYGVSLKSSCDSIDEQHGCTPPSNCDNFHEENISRLDWTNLTTRSVVVQKGIIEELHQCSTKQYPIPDLPAKLQKVVGTFVENLGLLVCGGFVQKEDTEDQPRPDQPKLCYVHELCSCEWKESYKLNTNRIEAHIKNNEDNAIIYGGLKSHPMKPCYQSQEVLDKNNLVAGWRQESIIVRCLPGQESIIEVPCLKDCNLKCNND